MTYRIVLDWARVAYVDKTGVKLILTLLNSSEVLINTWTIGAVIGINAKLI